MRRDVVGRNRRPPVVVPQVRVDLLLEHRLGERSVRLRKVDDPRSRRERPTASAECGRCLLNFDLADVQDLEKLEGGKRVALGGRHDEGVGRFVTFHPVLVNLVEVLEPACPILGHLLERRVDGNLAVLDYVPERPPAGVVRHGVVHPWRLWSKRPIGTSRIDEGLGETRTRNLRQDAGLTMVQHVLSGRSPQVVQLARDDAALARRGQRRRHRHADPSLALDEQRVDVWIVRIAERWHEHPRSQGAHLVHVVRHRRFEVAVDVDGEARFLLREHEPVAVVVVTSVPMVQIGIRAFERRARGLVPVIDDQHLAIRVLRRHHQDDGVVEDFVNLGRILGGQAMCDVDDGLAVSDLGRVDGRVEKVERHTFSGQRPCGVLRERSRIGEPVVDRDQPVQSSEVGWGTEGDQNVRVAVRRGAAHLVLNPVGAVGQMPKILENPRVASQLTVGADLEAKELGWRRDCLRPTGVGDQSDADGGKEKYTESRQHRERWLHATVSGGDQRGSCRIA